MTESQMYKGEADTMDIYVILLASKVERAADSGNQFVWFYSQR